MIYEKCKDILLQEFELVQNAVVLQDKIRTTVTERQWTAFEENLNAMNALEMKLEGLENEREELFFVFKTIARQQGFSQNLDENGRFYELIAFLPEKQRDDLTTIYRSLKIESTKLKLANEALLSHINIIKSTLRDFIDLAFVERGGKMYTKNGTHHSHDMRSMVLNQSF